MNSRLSRLLTTASGKGVEISEEACQRSKRVIEDWDGPKIVDDVKTIFTENKKEPDEHIGGAPSKERVSRLLTTASGKKITISEEASKKSKRVFQSWDNSNPEHHPEPDQSKSFTSIRKDDTGQQLASAIFLNTNDSLKFGAPKALEDITLDRTTQQMKISIVGESNTKSTTRFRTELIEEVISPNPYHIGNVVSVQTPSIDKFSLSNYPIYIILQPTRAVEEEVVASRLEMIGVISSSTATSYDLHFNTAQSEGYPFHLVLKQKNSLLSNSSIGSISRTVFDSIDAIQKLKLEDQHWVAMQIRWIVWTLASHERMKPNSYLLRLFTQEFIMEAIIWRARLYFRLPSAPNTFPTTFASLRKLDHTYSRKNASSHFAKKGSMSSLQRCCDIMVLLWPITVCFSISSTTKKDASKELILNEIKATDSPFYEVTDGWWWAQVLLDVDLQRLVTKGRLADGCKIVLFHAALEASSGDSNPSPISKSILKLSFNAVRKARPDARLGFVHPQYLSRGLSVATVSTGGGPIFALRFIVQHVSPTMYRVKVDNASFVMSRKEMDAFRQMNESTLYKQFNSLESSPLLSLSSLLDSMACDDETIQAIVNDESPEQMRADLWERVAVAREKLPGVYQDTLQKLAAEAMNATQIDTQRYVDILAECVISSKKFWLRYLCSSNGDGEESGPGTEFKPNNILMMTNLKPLRSLCNTPLVVATSQSTVKILVSTNDNNAIKNGIGVEISLPLRSFFAPNRVMAANGSEVKSFCMVIADWSVSPVDNNPNTASSSGSNAVKSAAVRPVQVEVVGYTEQRVCVIFQFVVLSTELMNKISWLSKSNVIQISYALVLRIDTQYDIQLFSRFDRTNITALDDKKAQFVLDYVICEETIRRLQALRSNGLCYQSVNVPDEVEMCVRHHLYDAVVTVPCNYSMGREISDMKVKVAVVIGAMTSVFEDMEMIVSTALMPIGMKVYSNRCDLVFVECFPVQDYYRNSKPIRRIKWIGLSGAMV